MANDGARADDEGWSAGARLYSGRVDPSWAVPAASARALLSLWAGLAPSARAQPHRGGVGYRGCWLRAPDGACWMARDGLVAARSPASLDVRGDPARAFERTLLATAPAGLVPVQLLPPPLR